MSTITYSTALKLSEPVSEKLLTFANYIQDNYTEDYTETFTDIIKIIKKYQSLFNYKKFVTMKFYHDELIAIRKELSYILTDGYPTLFFPLDRKDVRYLYNKVKNIRSPFRCCPCCSHTWDITIVNEEDCVMCRIAQDKEDEEREQQEKEDEEEEEELSSLPAPPQEWLKEIEAEESKDIDCAKENASYISSIIKEHFSESKSDDEFTEVDYPAKCNICKQVRSPDNIVYYQKTSQHLCTEGCNVDSEDESEDESDIIDKITKRATDYVYSCHEDPENTNTLEDYEYLIINETDNDLEDELDDLKVPESKRSNIIKLAKDNAIKILSEKDVVSEYITHKDIHGGRTIYRKMITHKILKEDLRYQKYIKFILKPVPYNKLSEVGKLFINFYLQTADINGYMEYFGNWYTANKSTGARPNVKHDRECIIDELIKKTTKDELENFSTESEMELINKEVFCQTIY